MKKEHTKKSLMALLKPHRVIGDGLGSAKKNILLEKAYELNLIEKTNRYYCAQFAVMRMMFAYRSKI